MVEEDATEKGEEGEKREIGKLAVWTVSSNKPGNGVEMLRDNNLTTYWQYNLAYPFFTMLLLFISRLDTIKFEACFGMLVLTQVLANDINLRHVNE